MTREPFDPARIEAVAFDLLTAPIDSRSLWIGVAGGDFEVVMNAERAGAYKTDRRAYRAMLSALGLAPERVLFVAGSAHRLPGAGAAGLPVYWSNRARLPVPAGAPPPVLDAPDLSALPDLVTAAP